VRRPPHSPASLVIGPSQARVRAMIRLRTLFPTTPSGDDPAEVFRDLLSVVGGRAIVAYALDYDGMCMKALAEAAGWPGDCPPLIGLGAVCGKLALWRGRVPEVACRKAEMAALTTHPPFHRAGPDARHNAEIMRQVAGL
jgi:hypothetical protein